MPLNGFDHQISWDEFPEVEVRPQGVSEDAEVFVHTPQFGWSTQHRRGRGCRVSRITVTIAVNGQTTWALKGKKSARLLAHEQGHYDISALGFREMYERIASLERRRCSAIERPARNIQRTVQRSIDRANERYDEQTQHC